MLIVAYRHLAHIKAQMDAIQARYPMSWETLVHFGGIVVDAVRNFPDVISGNYQVPLIGVASFRCVAIFLFSMTVGLTILLNKEE